MIEINQLSKTYGEKQVLCRFSASFPEGETICIMGKSGCGKTTLLRLMMGLEPPDNGSICGVQGKRISAVFQEDRLCENLSAVSNIRLVCANRFSRPQIEQSFAEVGLEGCLEQPVRELSGGMKRRVAIVRALLADFDLLFLDEPFKGLDPETERLTATYLLRKIAGKTVFLVSHNPRGIERMQGRLFRMPDPPILSEK